MYQYLDSQCTAATPVRWQWSYCSLALNHRYEHALYDTYIFEKHKYSFYFYPENTSTLVKCTIPRYNDLVIDLRQWASIS